MDTAIQGLNIDLSKILRDPLYLKSLIKDVDPNSVTLKDEEILNEVFCAFTSNFAGLKCYEELMLLHEESIEALKKYRNEENIDNLPSDRDIVDCFHNCLQRIVRYPLLIDDILRNINENDAYFVEWKLIYLRMTKFIGIVDKKKENYDNLRCSSMVLEKVSRLPDAVLGGEVNFIAQLNCEDLYGEPITLFLLSGMLIIAERKGPSVSILDSKSGRYVSKCAFRLERIEMTTFGKAGLKVLVSDVEEDSNDLYQIEEIYGDVSIGGLYFLGCSSNSRALFLEEFYKARILPSIDLYVSFGSLFFRVVRSPLDVDDDGDLVVYTRLEDFESSNRASIGYLDLENFSFMFKDDADVSYEYRVKQDLKTFRDKFNESLVNVIQFKRALSASRGTLKDSPRVFAKYRICLREIVEKYSNAAVARFDEELSKADLMSVSQKLNRVKAIIGYMNRSLSYMSDRITSFANQNLDYIHAYDADKIKSKGMERLLRRVLENSSMEDYIFDEYGIEDILYLLMYFIHTNVYSFASLEDISEMHRVLFVDKIYCLKTVVSSVNEASTSFVSSLFDLIVSLRGKVDLSSVVEAFLVILISFDIPRSEISAALHRVHW